MTPERDILKDLLHAAEHEPYSGLYEEAAAEIKALRARVEWQPIESAPRDGTRVLVWATRTGVNHHPRVVAARWYEEARSWYVYGCGGTGYSEQWLDSCEPTHWMPLPPLPSPETE